MKNGKLLDKIKNQFELLEKLPLGVKFYEEYHKYNEYAQEINKVFKIEKEENIESNDDNTILDSFLGYMTFKVIPIIFILEKDKNSLFEKLPKEDEKIFNDLKFHFGKLAKKEGDRDFEYWFTHTDKLFNDFLDNIKTTKKGNDFFIQTNIMNVMHELLDLLEKQKINKELKTSTIKTIDKNDIHKLVLMYKDYLKKNGEEKTKKEFSFSLRDKNELNILTIYQEENKTKEELMSPVYIFQTQIKNIENSLNTKEEKQENFKTLKEEMNNNDWTEIDIHENDDYYILDPKPIEKEEEIKEVIKNFKKRFEEFNCVKGLNLDYTYILSDEMGDMYFAEENYQIRLNVLENLIRIGLVKSWEKKKEIFNDGAKFITAICKIDEDKFIDENKEKIIKQSNLFSHTDSGKHIIFSINGSDCYETPKNNLYSKFFKLISKENKSDLNIGIIFNNLYINKKEVLSEEQKIQKLKGILKQTKMGPLKNRKYDLSIRYNKNILSLSIKEVKSQK